MDNKINKDVEKMFAILDKKLNAKEKELCLRILDSIMTKVEKIQKNILND